MARQDVTAQETGGRNIRTFFTTRWRGDVPLSLLFWRDMVVVGTAISIASTLIAVLMLGLHAPLALVLAMHFGPLPYNVFLFLAVWRTSGRLGGWRAQLAPLGAAVWLGAATLV